MGPGGGSLAGPGPMIHLCYSNRTEALLEVLVRALDARRARGDALEPVHVVVPNRNMERYVELGVAHALGIAANIVFHRLERFVGRFVEEALEGARVFDCEAFETRLLRALLDPGLRDAKELAPVARYLGAAGDDADAIDLRRIQLAQRLARLFEEYAFSRPEMLARWELGERAIDEGPFAPSEAWQRALYLEVVRPREGDPRIALHEALARIAPKGAAPFALEEDRPPPFGASAVHVFGVSYVARAFQWVFAALARRTELRLYTLNPCMEFWEDLDTVAEQRNRTRAPHRGERLGEAALEAREDPFGLGDGGASDDTPALRLWGRPGREHVRLLNELTECDFQAVFRDPLEAGHTRLLLRLQHDILVREPERTEPLADAPAVDDSVQVLACPGVRREVEAVADAIWQLVEASSGTGAPLRFNDIAVIVNGQDRDVYMPHLDAVFAEAHRIPHNVVDVPLVAGSRVVEAALLLADLPTTRFTRPEVLDVVTHPAVCGDTVDAGAWVELVDRVGIFRGIDHDEHAGTYVTRDILSWDQGVRRLALGAFMTGEQSGDMRALSLDGERYAPEESLADEQAARLGALVRSLAADARFARDATLPLAEWARFFGGLFEGYLSPASDAEEADLRRCLAAAQALAERGLDTPVSYRIALELVRASLSDLSGGRGEYLADGVVVSSFLPMRAIPFRAIFLLGLGEGRFPAAERRDTMDLRAARRRAGDVSPAERDRYMFLEALLSARERLVLSYVARDELTGDALAPSAVVQELSHILARGYLPPGGEGALVRTVPLRRFTDAPNAPPPSIDEALREQRARALGEDLRRHLAAEGRFLDGAEQMDLVRREAGPGWNALRDVLAIPRVPSLAANHAVPGSANDRITLSLSQLRGFLECPMQGWARAVLRLADGEDHAPEAHEDEPFEPGGLDKAVLLRDAWVRAGSGASREAIYSEMALRLEERGRWPVGALGELRAAEDERCFEAWDACLRAVPELRLRDTASVEARLSRIRFGGGLEHGQADRPCDAIVLQMPDPRPGREGKALHVDVVGALEPMVLTPRGSITLVTSAHKSGVDGALQEARYALRGFFTHVALCASGAFDLSAHAAWTFFAGGSAKTGPIRFAPIATATARDYLATLARDLIGAPHGYLFPCEAVFVASRGDWARVTGELLVDAAAWVRDERDGGGSRFGPVARHLDQPIPQPAEALAMTRRRFGPFFEWREP